MKCPICKKTIPDNALKCPYCKARTGLLCKNCNTVNSIFDFTCKKCGKEFFPRWQSDKILTTEDMNVDDFMALYKAMKKKAEST